MNETSIYSYVQAEEARFQTDEIRVGDNWLWNFRKHVQLIFHLKNGVFFTGENNWLRAFKNIMEPMLNLSYWAEDIEVKDIVFYIEEATGRVLSFLIKKYHDEVFVREHDLDMLFDEITESDLDYGGVLVQRTDTPKPEVFDLQSIAFCDQTDILGGPIAFKHYFSPDKLRGMAKFGWGDEKNGATITIEDLILLAQPEKAPAGMMNTKTNKTTGKQIEVYFLRGNLCEDYLEDNGNEDDYYNQVQILAFYYDKDSKKQGVTLYRKKEEEGNIKFHTSKKVYGRALGRGEGEGLLHPQVWTNFATIHEHNLLEAAGKTVLYTDDESYTQKNRIQDMENLEITTIADQKRILVVPTADPTKLALLEQSVGKWMDHAQLTGSAFDAMLGKMKSSGATFRGQAQQIQQGRGLHDRRRGQRAKFLEEIYRDWIIPDIKKSILKGKKFLATLSTEEMQWVVDGLVDNAANQFVINRVLNSKPWEDLTNIAQERDAHAQEIRKQFSKRGSKHLLEILKGEFDDIEIRMGINIAGKQKDLIGLSDKVLSIFQSALANPQAFQQTMQLPGMAKAFQDILEFSGVSGVDFAALTSAPALQPPMQPQQQQDQQQPVPQQLPANTRAA